MLSLAPCFFILPSLFLATVALLQVRVVLQAPARLMQVTNGSDFLADEGFPHAHPVIEVRLPSLANGKMVPRPRGMPLLDQFVRFPAMCRRS